MALIGNVIASAFAGNPALINYDIFVATFSMLSLFYLIAAAWNESFMGHPIIPVTLDLLNAIFFFTAAIAMAAELGAHSCSNDVRIPSLFPSIVLPPHHHHKPYLHSSVLYRKQPPHKRLERPLRPLPRGASLDRLPMVWLGLLHGLALLQLPRRKIRWSQSPLRRNSERWAEHVSSLSSR
jgi:hypothetical protein